MLLLSVAGARPPPGLVQVGAVSFASVIDPRGVLREFGPSFLTTLRFASGTGRGVALPCPPERPPGTEAMTEEELAALVTRDSMIGVAKVTSHRPETTMNGVHDMGGLHGMGPVAFEKDEPVFHAPWEGRVYALTRAMRAWRKWSLTPTAMPSSACRQSTICA